MAVIYLQHEKHGQKVATSVQEAQYDESKGWRRFVPSAPAPSPEPPLAVEPLPDFLNALAAPKRRGRPPKSPVEVPQETE